MTELKIIILLSKKKQRKKKGHIFIILKSIITSKLQLILQNFNDSNHSNFLSKRLCRKTFCSIDHYT